MEVHARIHTGESPYHCTVCEDEFCLKVFLDEHLFKVHGIRGDIRHFCDTCGKGFPSSGRLREHSKTHLEKDNTFKFTCELCGDEFVHAYTFRAHKNRHDKKFECEICDKIFGVRKWFEQHMRRHDGIKDFKCYVCKKEYTSMRSLRMHKEIKHSIISDKKESFSCHQCGKSYTNIMSLNRHMAKHVID